jgi:signal transduction protein with GAF and PtsI domain
MPFEELLGTGEFLDLVLQMSEAMALSLEFDQVDVASVGTNDCSQTSTLFDRNNGVIFAVENEQWNPCQVLGLCNR